jgi:PAS domain S-box-containing protein
LISDTKQEEGWGTFKGHRDLRSWLSVPLVASDQYMGFLSVGHTDPNRFTQEHLRRAELLAIPAAAGILNARLYQRADIYGSELERRLADLRQAEVALEQSEEGRRISEDKFQKVFRSSPIAFSISTLSDGRYIEVNGAFEQRYGYSRTELVGHTADELRVWEDPAERTRLVDQLRQGRRVRNFVTRFRTKAGDLIVTVFSADTIQVDGQVCLLAVSGDVLEYEKQKLN